MASLRVSGPHERAFWSASDRTRTGDLRRDRPEVLPSLFRVLEPFHAGMCDRWGREWGSGTRIAPPYRLPGRGRIGTRWVSHEGGPPARDLRDPQARPGKAFLKPTRFVDHGLRSPPNQRRRFMREVTITIRAARGGRSGQTARGARIDSGTAAPQGVGDRAVHRRAARPQRGYGPGPVPCQESRGCASPPRLGEGCSCRRSPTSTPTTSPTGGRHAHAPC